jgi:hypothetical protein
LNFILCASSAVPDPRLEAAVGVAIENLKPKLGAGAPQLPVGAAELFLALEAGLRPADEDGAAPREGPEEIGRAGPAVLLGGRHRGAVHLPVLAQPVLQIVRRPVQTSTNLEARGFTCAATVAGRTRAASATASPFRTCSSYHFLRFVERQRRSVVSA